MLSTMEEGAKISHVNEKPQLWLKQTDYTYTTLKYLPKKWKTVF